MNKQLFGLALLLSATAGQVTLNAEPKPLASAETPVRGVIPTWGPAKTNGADTGSNSRRGVLTEIALKGAKVAATAGAAAVAFYAAGRLNPASAEAIVAAVQVSQPSTFAHPSEVIHPAGHTPKNPVSLFLDYCIAVAEAQSAWFKAELDAAQHPADIRKKTSAAAAFEAAAKVVADLQLLGENHVTNYSCLSWEKLQQHAKETDAAAAQEEKAVAAATKWAKFASGNENATRANKALVAAKKALSDTREFQTPFHVEITRRTAKARAALLGDVAASHDADEVDLCTDLADCIGNTREGSFIGTKQDPCQEADCTACAPYRRAPTA
jgi:hypothetical protein